MRQRSSVLVEHSVEARGVPRASRGVGTVAQMVSSFTSPATSGSRGAGVIGNTSALHAEDCGIVPRALHAVSVAAAATSPTASGHLALRSVYLARQEVSAAGLRSGGGLLPLRLKRV